MSDAGLRRVSVRVGSARAEEARAVMLTLFPEGFEEVDAEGDLELAAYTTSRGEERLWHAFGPGTSAGVVADWRERWKTFHRPVRVGPLWVGPPWETPDHGALAVVVDPGRAFGTGGHPTTRLCLELLLERAPGSAVDVGCGSGVLAIAAAKLGFAPVVALDHDEAAVQATTSNALANGVAVEARRADVVADVLPPARLALANITLAAAERIGRRIDADEAIVSGYVAGERPRLHGWRHAERREADGWAADLFVRA